MKRAKIPQQKWNHFLKESKFLNKNGTISVRKGSKFLNKNSTITEKGQKSSTKMVPFQERVKTLKKMVPFQKMVKIPQQKWYHFRQKWVKIPNKMVTFQKRIKNPQRKWYHLRVKNPRQKMVPFQSVSVRKGHDSSTKKVPFQKRDKIPQQKWNHFRRWSNIINRNGIYPSPQVRAQHVCHCAIIR